MVLDCRGSREWVAVLIWTTGLLATRLQIVHIQWPEFAITLLTFKLFLFEFYILQNLVWERGEGRSVKVEIVIFHFSMRNRTWQGFSFYKALEGISTAPGKTEFTPMKTVLHNFLRPHFAASSFLTARHCAIMLLSQVVSSYTFCILLPRHRAVTALSDQCVLWKKVCLFVCRLMKSKTCNELHTNLLRYAKSFTEVLLKGVLQRFFWAA